LADWREVPEHISLKKELDSNLVSCASAGCHGFAHPFFKSQAQLDAKPPLPPATGSGSGSNLAHSEAVDGTSATRSGHGPAQEDGTAEEDSTAEEDGTADENDADDEEGTADDDGSDEKGETP
jgi:hypothetical protein